MKNKHYVPAIFVALCFMVFYGLRIQELKNNNQELLKELEQCHASALVEITDGGLTVYYHKQPLYQLRDLIEKKPSYFNIFIDYMENPGKQEKINFGSYKILDQSPGGIFFPK